MMPRLRLLPLLVLLLATVSAIQGSAWAVANQLTVSIIGVGQGDSILVQFPNGQDMLVDAGDQVAGPTVVQYLRSRGITRIDILVATHPHADHIGGMSRVLAAFPVGKVWDSGYGHGSRVQEQYLSMIKAKGIRFGMPKAGFCEKVGEATITVLAPARPLTGTNSDANNNSLVLRISYGNVSFLLTGDMESEERATVAAWSRATVLKVAHHGSRNGTDSAFAKTVAPQYTVISYAQGNSYGHPHREALSALRATGAKVLRTAIDGTVVFTTDGRSLTYTTVQTASGVAAVAPAIEGPAPAATTPVTTAASESSYIGNARSKVFHRPSCHTPPSAKNQVFFNSREEAINQGYRPCKNCNP